MHALASRTPLLGLGRAGYISKDIEAAVSVQVESEMATFAFGIMAGGLGEVFRRRQVVNIGGVRRLLGGSDRSG